MDPVYELASEAYSRVKKIDARNVSKVIGYLLLQEDPKLEMARICLKSDSDVLSIVSKVKHQLGICDNILESRGNVFGSPKKLSLNPDARMYTPSSRQIYITFPGDSAFTEEDVNAHFSAYGPVQDVRMPYQEKRMYGFVTFVYSETVRIVLSEGNPHYICGHRVLVKPYRDRLLIKKKFEVQPKFLQDVELKSPEKFNFAKRKLCFNDFLDLEAYGPI